MLQANRRHLSTTARNRYAKHLLATVAYEGLGVPHAGITAVINQSLKPLADAASGRSVLILPGHRVLTLATRELTCMGSFEVPFERSLVCVEIICAGQTFYLRPKDARFFAGGRHPYDLPPQILLRDSLFFGKGVSLALPIIAEQMGLLDAKWRLICHDWEGVTSALALAGNPDCESLLVLHNVYDGSLPGQGLPSEMLRQVDIDPALCPGPGHLHAPTVLERALCLGNVKWPVLAVSSEFRNDILEDEYLRDILASHLAPLLRERLQGNDNGLFSRLAVPVAYLAEVARGNHQPLRDWKAAGKPEFLAALRNHVPTDEKPVWGDRDSFIDADTPDAVWFVTGGRDDSRQRGHDVLAAALPEFLDRSAEARCLFFVMPGDEGLPGLGFLKRLAEQYPAKVIVLPFRFAEGYLAALRAATWAVMPSLYGPFESANEFYLLGGLPGVARACGGLLEQIVPLRSAQCFSRAVQSRAEQWHTMSAAPTGILYRERDGLPDTRIDWTKINDADYGFDVGSDRVASRLELPLFRAMVRQLSLALDDALQVSRDHTLYYRMIADGISYLMRSFSWNRNAAEIVDLLLE